MEDFDYIKYLKNNPLLNESEQGTKDDVELHKIIGNSIPFADLLWAVKEDWGKGDLYFELEEAIFDKDADRIKSILQNYDVWDDYKHMLNLNESEDEDWVDIEQGGEEDIDNLNMKYQRVLPNKKILIQVMKDSGRGSDLYHTLLAYFSKLNHVKGYDSDMSKIKDILKKYEVWDKYSHFFNMNEDRIKSLIKKTLDEMSVTGGGGAGAGFEPGIGMNYATPKAFKKVKKKK
jgi:hypothetical protein